MSFWDSLLNNPMGLGGLKSISSHFGIMGMLGDTPSAAADHATTAASKVDNPFLRRNHMEVSPWNADSTRTVDPAYQNFYSFDPRRYYR